MVLICPYCESEISEKQVEAEDGCCPECGTLITANSVMSEEGDLYEEDEFSRELNGEFDDVYEDDLAFDESFPDLVEEPPVREKKEKEK